jgi:hypothetical protein
MASRVSRLGSASTLIRLEDMLLGVLRPPGAARSGLRIELDGACKAAYRLKVSERNR